MTNQTQIPISFKAATIATAVRRRWTALLGWVDDCTGAITAVGLAAGSNASGDASFEAVLLFSLLGLTVSVALLRFLPVDVISLALSPFD
jgi:hypothetical protein